MKIFWCFLEIKWFKYYSNWRKCTNFALLYDYIIHQGDFY